MQPDEGEDEIDRHPRSVRRFDHARCRLRALSPSLGENAEPAPSFQAHVDMKTFMEHVLTPAAKIVWSVNAVMIDEKGSTTCPPRRKTIGNGSSAAPRRLPKPPTP